MRLEQLEYVNAVTQLGSLRRASEHLHVSQAALSEAVSNLEKELGVTLFDRRRSGARISRQGRELLPRMVEILDAADGLRAAAGHQKSSSPVVRLGTVNTATSQLLVPALKSLHRSHPRTTVDVLDLMQPDIQVGLEEGTLDLGLINLLGGEDLPVNVHSTPLLEGRPVAVVPADHRLAQAPEITVEELRAEPFVLMRTGYLMHRFAHRLFGERLPQSCRRAGSAEMGKLLVAEGLGLTLLPDFSIAGDPLERAGLIVQRPIAGDDSRVRLMLLHRRGGPLPERVRALAHALARRSTDMAGVARADPLPETPTVVVGDQEAELSSASP